MTTKKNWQKEIEAWKAGHTIQEYEVFTQNNAPFGWSENPNPDWNPFKQFRIKPNSQPVKALKQLKTKQARKAFLWNCTWISTMLTIVVQLQLIVTRHFPDDWVMHFAALFAALALILTVVREVEILLRRSWLKAYLIEDHGNVLKLYETVMASDVAAAHRDLLSKPGYKIADDAYDKFGCTIAAVKAWR